MLSEDFHANLATYPALRKHYQLLRLKQIPILKVENLHFLTHMKLFYQEIFKKLWMMLQCLLNWHQPSLKQQKSVSSMRRLLRHAEIVSEETIQEKSLCWGSVLSDILKSFQKTLFQKHNENSKFLILKSNPPTLRVFQIKL